MKKALIVGIDEYKQNKLFGCVNDANEVEKLLKRNEDNSINFSVRKKLNIQTKAELKREIYECFNGDDEVALFYFSGHGFIDSIGGYLVTPDYQSFDIGVSMQEILSIVNDSRCKNRVVILDCCHSGFMGSISTSQQNTTSINEGVSILTASKSTQTSLEVNGRGIFTSLLIDALNGGAADIIGSITLGSIYAYIDKSLGPWGQRPVFKTNTTRFFSIRKVNPKVDLDVLRNIDKYFINVDDEYKLDPSFEPTNTPEVEHEIIKPFACKNNVLIFAELQKLESVGIIIPSGEKHMYFAAMKSKACKLTSLGRHYWRLVKGDFI